MASDRITGVGAPIASAARRVSGPAARAFTLAGSGRATPNASDVTSAAPPALLSGLLAVQEALSERGRNRNAHRHGEAVLEGLARLQVSLLLPDDETTGALNRADLVRLATLVAEIPPVDDPTLTDVLAAVAIRAHIELARRGIDELALPETPANETGAWRMPTWRGLGR